MLMAQGVYKGPAVLLNPAVRKIPDLCANHCKVDTDTGVPDMTAIPEDLRKWIIVQQGEEDDFLKDVESWCNSQEIKLRTFSGVVRMEHIEELIKGAISEVCQARS